MIFVLIDTNVILDFALRRGNDYAPAAEIMSYIVSGRVVAHVSASQITDIYYFIRKEHPHEVAVQAVAAKTMNVNIVVTRDQTGYTDSGMTVFTPQEFLTYLDNQ